MNLALGYYDYSQIEISEALFDVQQITIRKAKAAR